MNNAPHSTGKVLRSFWPFCRPDRSAYQVSILLMLLTLGFDLSRPFVLKSALDSVAAGLLDSMKIHALIFLALLLLEYLTRAGFNYLLSMAFLKTINRIRQAVFDHVLRLKMAFFDHEPVGRLMTRTISDAESLGETLRAGMATIGVDILTVIGVFVVMLNLELSLSPVMMISLPVVFLLVRFTGRRLRKKYIEIRTHLARANGSMAEGIAGVEIVQLFHQQTPFLERFRDINKAYRKATITSNVYDASLYASIDALAAWTSAGVLWVAATQTFGPVEISSLIVYLSLIDRIFVPIRDLSNKFTVIQQALAAYSRISDLLFSGSIIPSGSTSIPDDDLTITFQEVSFAYSEEANRALDRVSFTVHPGQVLALVGKTGGGKSTVGKLLTRSYAGYTGSIRVGGVEIAEANLDSLRSRIAVVHQDFEVFPGTIRENIRLFNPHIGDDRIWQAVDRVKARDMLESLDGGLDFMIKENGKNLSAGQLQLIVFARALAHDTPIVLMDEATSSVDSITEAWIQQALMEILKHKTVIVVAHRLSTISAADQILVLRGGRVVQQGNHESLMSDTQGYYAQLVHATHHQEQQG